MKLDFYITVDGQARHIAKITDGWKALFDGDNFTSVREIKRTIQHDDLTIYDQSNEGYTWHDFIGIVDDREMSQSHIDWVEENPFLRGYYFKDKDGYEFMKYNSQFNSLSGEGESCQN